jgi:GNAT superfamily N-acetyltransferase
VSALLQSRAETTPEVRSSASHSGLTGRLPAGPLSGPLSVTLRAAGPSDVEFLFQVYADIRADELAPVPWPAQLKEQFLRQQFHAQDNSYRANYPGAEFSIIQVDGADAGRLYLHRRQNEIRIMDIALTAPFRGRGLGTLLLRRILGEGDARRLPVTIHVEFFNPARKLYERLGFRQTSQTEVYLLMEWLPSGTAGHRFNPETNVKRNPSDSQPTQI